jgi:hypothetical protein
MDFRVFGVKEFISGVIFVIRSGFDLQIQDGRRLTVRNSQLFKIVLEPSYYVQMKALFVYI